MTKYVLEGGIDFFSELYNSLDDTHDSLDNIKSEQNNICLISQQLLVDKFVELDCGHKFNYIPLYNDIKNHKHKFNSMEGKSTHLKINEIRCPYCRSKSKCLLPYYEDLGLPKITGVNNLSNSYISQIQKCSYECNNPNYDEQITVDTSNAQMIFKCYNMGTQINYFDGQLCGENYGDEKCYCWKHKKQMVKKYKKEISDKMKEDIKLSKLQSKEKIKQEKINLKMNIKSNINTSDENIVLLTGVEKLLTGVENTIGCTELIKTGKNKNLPCKCVIFCENKCKRHFNLQNKKPIL